VTSVSVIGCRDGIAVTATTTVRFSTCTSSVRPLAWSATNTVPATTSATMTPTAM
jgi:hypothetical protein